jgi:hypothetical protein
MGLLYDIQQSRTARQELQLKKRQDRRDHGRSVREWITLIGIPLAGIAAFVSIWSLRTSIQSLKTVNEHAVTQEQLTRREDVVGRELDLDQMLVNHPEVVPYITQRRTDTATAPNYQAELAAETTVDYMEYLYDEMIYQGIVPKDGNYQLPVPGSTDWTSWQADSQWAMTSFQESPLMCTMLSKYKYEYDSNFVGAVVNLKVCSNL